MSNVLINHAKFYSIGQICWFITSLQLRVVGIIEHIILISSSVVEENMVVNRPMQRGIWPWKVQEHG